MERNDFYYLQAAAVLPAFIRIAAEGLPADTRVRAEEFRLRTGHPPTVSLGGEEVPLNCPPVTREDLHTLLGQASRYSAHMVQGQLCAGYLTLRGGHRVGLCGEVTVRDGEIRSVRTLSSASVRIARPVEGFGRELTGALEEEGVFRDTLILAPPGGGKTTLLREAVRRISDGVGMKPRRVGLADERCEVSALWDGQAQFDVGGRTDIVADCPKALAVPILIRGMTPQVLAMDEITAEEDLDALLWAAGCGVSLLATAHGQGVASLRSRPLYRRLLDCGVFRQAVVLSVENGVRTMSREVLP